LRVSVFITDFFDVDILKIPINTVFYYSFNPTTLDHGLLWVTY